MSQEKKLKVLLIEDEQPIVDILVTKLEKEGYDVSFAYDGEEGYKMIEKIRPNLILLDIMMPKLDGYGVLERMKEKGISIPAIIISNSGQPVEIEKTKKLGAVDHLIKTEFNPSEVVKKIKGIMDSQGNIVTDTKTIQLNKIEDQQAKQLGINVLLVEDDSFLRDICGKKLAKEGYTVYEAIDGNQALEGFKLLKPDIVLLDIILPAIDGFQVLGEIRRNPDPKLAKVPIIMLSNLGQDDDINKAMKGGANDYLVKAHFTVEEIVDKIKKILAGKVKK